MRTIKSITIAPIECWGREPVGALRPTGRRLSREPKDGAGAGRPTAGRLPLVGISTMHPLEGIRINLNLTPQSGFMRQPLQVKEINHRDGDKQKKHGESTACF